MMLSLLWSYALLHDSLPVCLNMNYIESGLEFADGFCTPSQLGFRFQISFILLHYKQ